MRPRPGRHGTGAIRLVPAVLATGLMLTGCAGDDDVAKSASGSPGKGTYVNGSSPQEFCSVLEDVKASLGTDVDAGDDAMLTAIHTINDIEPLAPEEAKADLSGLRLIMRAVVEASGSDQVGTMSRDEAGEIYAEFNGRVSDSVANICGFRLG